LDFVPRSPLNVVQIPANANGGHMRRLTNIIDKSANKAAMNNNQHG
jgi:hypothetical protein